MRSLAAGLIGAFLATGVVAGVGCGSGSHATKRAVLVPARVDPADKSTFNDLRLWSYTRPAETRYPSPNQKYSALVKTNGTLSLTEGDKVLWAIQWPQEAPPYNVLVSDDGRRVVLINTFHQGRHGEMAGNGRELVVVGPEGKLLSAYKGTTVVTGTGRIEEVFTYGPHSQGVPPASIKFDDGASLLRCLWPADSETPDGGTRPSLVPIGIDTESGDQVALQPAEIDDLMKSFIQELRKEFRSNKVDEREDACYRAGQILDKGSIPELKRLLDDNSVTGMIAIGDRPLRNLYGVRETAARSLGEMLGKEAGPIFKAHLATSQGRAREAWLEALSRINVMPNAADLELLAQSKFASDRSDCLEMLEGSKSPLALKFARKLIDDTDSRVRLDALSILSDQGTRQDIPILKRFLDDPDIRFEAESGLQRLKATGGS